MDAPGGEEVAIADQQNQTQDGNKAAEEDHQVDQITTADRQTAVREFVDFTEYLPSDISRTLNILQKMDLAYESHKTELERAAIAMSGAVPLEALTNGPTIIPVPSQLAIEHPESSSQHQHQEQQQPEQTDSNLPAPVSASTPPPPPPAATPAVPDAAAPIPESKPDADTQLTNGTDSTPAPSLTVASLFGPPGKILLPNNEYMRMRVNMSQELNRALKAREQALAEAEKMGLMASRHKARAAHIYEKMKAIPIPNQSAAPPTPKKSDKDKSKSGSGRIVLGRAGDPARRDDKKRSYKKRDGAPKERRRKNEDGTDAEGRKKVGRSQQSLQKLALLPPLTADGRPIPPEDMPWNRLLPHELARLRKRMKKNTTWTPSTTMILKELEGLGRGPVNKEKYRHQWEGKEDEYIAAEEGGIGKLAYGSGGKDVGENKGMKLNAAKRKLKEQKAIEGGLLPSSSGDKDKPAEKKRKKEPTLRTTPAFIPPPILPAEPTKEKTSHGGKEPRELKELRELKKKPEMVQRMSNVEIPSPSKRKEKKRPEPKESKEAKDAKAPKEAKKASPVDVPKDNNKDSSKDAEPEVYKDVVVPEDKSSGSSPPKDNNTTGNSGSATEGETQEAQPEKGNTEDVNMDRDDTHDEDADGDVDVDAEGEPEGDDADADAEAEPDFDVEMAVDADAEADAEGEQDTSLVVEAPEKDTEPVVKESEQQSEQNGVHDDQEKDEAEKQLLKTDAETHKEEPPAAEPKAEEAPPPADLKVESDAEAEKPAERAEAVPADELGPEADGKPVVTDEARNELIAPEAAAPPVAPPAAPVAPVAPAAPPAATSTRKNNPRKKKEVDVPPPPPLAPAENGTDPASTILTEVDKAAENVAKDGAESSSTEKNGNLESSVDTEVPSKEKGKRAPAKRAKKAPKKNVPPLPPMAESQMLQAAPPPPTPTTTGGRQRKSPKKIDVPPPPPPAPSAGLPPIHIPIPNQPVPSVAQVPAKAPRKERKSSKSATPAPPPVTTPSTTLPPIPIPHPSTLTSAPTTSTPIPHIPIPIPSIITDVKPHPAPHARTTRGSGRPSSAKEPTPSLPPPASPISAANGTHGRGTKRKRPSISQHPAEPAPSPTEVKRPTKPPPKRRKKATKKAANHAEPHDTVETTKAASVSLDEPEEEPVYCVCRRVSDGTMVMCDNPNCEKEWFHLGCVGLKQAPSSKRKWYCPECIEKGIDKELEGVDNSSAVGVDALPVGKKI